MTIERAARLIAFYLPQYYPIPENDAWWGKGFTEWTNVARARPLFPGHYQPHVPADLGFYDLRVPETRQAQADMARSHGIEGFAYWHYWFGNARRLLDRPFSEVLKSGEPDFPFCLAWANESWTGIWYGARDRVLIEQTYPGPRDEEEHFYAVLDAFCDPRYITVDGKPLFVVFAPRELPEPRRFTDHWRELALRAGLKGVYFVGFPQFGWREWEPNANGFDAAILINMHAAFSAIYQRIPSRLDPLFYRIKHQSYSQWRRERSNRPFVIPYSTLVEAADKELASTFVQYPCVIPNWDNTPRSGKNGLVFHESTPQLFASHLETALLQVCDRDPQHRIVFVKSWNEWAEGNYLEPDQRFGLQYLQVVRGAVVK